MPFLDKNKLNITLVLHKDNVTAGETLSGNMNAEVIETMKLTALRVHITGEEIMYRRENYFQRDQSGFVSSNRQTKVSTHKFMDQIATVLGEQSGRGGRGSIELEPGNYSYPFSFVLPADLPPTYAVRKDEYGGYIFYNVKAVVDIPMGFDKNLNCPFTVYKAAPLSQVYEARAAPAVLPTAQSEIATCGCCCCYCRHEKDSYISTTAMLAPAIAVMQRSAAAPFLPSTAAVSPLPATKRADDWGPVAQPPMNVSGDPSVITLRVIVDNNTKSTNIASAQVKLTQYVTYLSGAVHPIGLVNRTFAFEQGVLPPGESTTFDCLMSISDCGPNSAFVLPTFTAHFVKVNVTLEVEFPNVKTDARLRVADAIKLVSAIDTTNTVPPV